MNKRRVPELLLPAGSLSRLETAFLYGADAVYMGLPSLSMRAKSGFTAEEMREGMKLARTLGKKAYLALNMFSENKDIPKLEGFLKTIRDSEPDGLIVSDPGVFAYVREQAPEIPLHVSTQANIGSYLTASFWQKLGASRIVLGREVSFKDMKEIKRRCPGLEIEQFVHGAMCMSYSGRCLISAFLTGRSANKGACTHSCRWKYKFYLEEETRPGELFEMDEDDKGTYLMNSKDLNLMPHLSEILETGVDSLKVEGRNKSEYYVAVTARAYRHAIDAWKKDPDGFDPALYVRELSTLQSRGYTEGFHNGRPGKEAQEYGFSASLGDWRTAGAVDGVREDGLLFVPRNPVCAGETIEFLSPKRFEPFSYRFDRFVMADDGEEKNRISPGNERQVLLPYESFDLDGEKVRELFPPRTVVRKKL